MTAYLGLLGAVAPVFIIIAAGFAIRRTGLLTTEADSSLLKLSINILYPCLILDKVLGNPALEKMGNVLLPPAVGFATAVLGYILCIVGARYLPLDQKQARTFAFTAGMYNYGYIPIPLVQKFFDRETMGVLFTHNLGVEIAFWTAGLFILTRGSSEKGGWRNLLSAPVFAIVIAVVLNFYGAHEWLPSWLLISAQMLGQSYVPLILVLTGATFADQLPKNPIHIADIVTVAGCALRMLILPALFLLIARFLPCSAELKRIIVIQAAMPAAMLPVILAKHYGGDADTALKIVFSTVLISLFTIPLWMRIGFHFVGI
jgi:malate permease and related proteins